MNENEYETVNRMYALNDQVEIPPQGLVTVVNSDWENRAQEKSGFELSVQTVNLDLGFPHCLGWPQTFGPVTKPHITLCAVKHRTAGGGQSLET